MGGGTGTSLPPQSQFFGAMGAQITAPPRRPPPNWGTEDLHPLPPPGPVLPMAGGGSRMKPPQSAVVWMNWGGGSQLVVLRVVGGWGGRGGLIAAPPHKAIIVLQCLQPAPLLLCLL